MGTPQTPAAPKMGTLMNLNRVLVSNSKSQAAQASLSVAVRVRPILKSEQQANSSSNKRDIIRVMDGKIVVVLDPDEIKDYLDQVQNRTKEKRYTFDVAYDTQARNNDVYMGSIQQLAAGVTKGLNGTVFAYGATGSGKTHTMVGNPADPGLMVLSLSQIFREKAAHADTGEEFTVTCSYLEVYNEMIYDLLVKNSGPLELREDPDQGVCVAGLKHIQVTSAAEIMGLLEEGNRRRKTDSTDANAASSRSHAVLEIVVRRWPRNQYRANVLIGKLTLVDLAGSERAAETNNAGQKLRDGANINKSLLALANCINALGKQQKTGVAYVPYRNSKLTRLLKDSLRGNSRTAMVATIGAAADQYHHSVNTLKYADRAKEIKTHVVQNVGSVERHITDYQNIIDNLQNEVQSLKARLADRPGVADTAGEMANMTALPADLSINGAIVAAGDAAAGAGSNKTSGCGPGNGAAVCSNAEADTLAWIDALAQEINENVEERINLQKALFELEDINVCNQYELQNIEDMLKADTTLSPEDAAEAKERRTVLLEEIQENDAEAQHYRADIAANEATRREIQAKIETAIDANSNVNFLKILSTFRIQAVRLQELKFQMAVRDQIISEQRDVISNLWAILGASGLTQQQVMEIARQQGIVMQGLEHEDLSPNGQQDPASQVSVLGSLPQGGEGGSRMPDTPTLALPGAPAGVQQSLMGGKARFRYRFWQQYQARDSQSCTGSPLQSLHSPILLQAPQHSHRNRTTDAASGADTSSSNSFSHQGKGGSTVPVFPALHHGRLGPDAAATAVGAHLQQQQHVRNSSLLRGRPQPPPPPPPPKQQQQQQQGGPGKGQQHNKQNAIKRAPRELTPERSSTSVTAAAAGSYHHLQQQQQQVGNTNGLKRYNLPAPAAGAANAAAHAGGMRRHHSGSLQQSTVEVSAYPRATNPNTTSSSNEKGVGYHHAGAGQLGGKGAGAYSSSSSSSPYDQGQGQVFNPARHHGGRRQKHSERRKVRHDDPTVSISSGNSLHPGLPGQQQQLENALSALRKMKSQTLATAGTAAPASAAQQQQQHVGQLARNPLQQQQQQHGRLAWQESAAGLGNAQQQQQWRRQQKEQQLSAAYGTSDKFAKLKRHHPRKASSAVVSAEPSHADLAAEHSTPSVFSHPVSTGAGEAAAAAASRAAAGGHTARPADKQQRQWPSIRTSASQTGSIEQQHSLAAHSGQPGHVGQPSHGAASGTGLPAISEASKAAAGLAELRRRQLQTLQHRMTKDT